MTLKDFLKRKRGVGVGFCWFLLVSVGFPWLGLVDFG